MEKNSLRVFLLPFFWVPIFANSDFSKRTLQRYININATAVRAWVKQLFTFFKVSWNFYFNSKSFFVVLCCFGIFFVHFSCLAYTNLKCLRFWNTFTNVSMCTSCKNMEYKEREREGYFFSLSFIRKYTLQIISLHQDECIMHHAYNLIKHINKNFNFSSEVFSFYGIFFARRLFFFLSI